jgi:hypothetical protein
MEISDVRRRLRIRLDQAKQAAAERRARHDEAGRHYEEFLQRTATPIFRLMAMTLKAEGHPFAVSTPAGSVRLASESNAEDFVEIALDATGDRPEVVGRSSRGRGRRVVKSERPIQEGREPSQISEEDVLVFLLDEVVPFIQR